MSGGYTKLFSDIVDSSIWDEDGDICKVWITLLALSDKNGFVRGSIGWIAAKARVTAVKCQEAIAKFSAPDPSSRTPDNDGRRVECLLDGWLILNYISYRDRLSSDPIASATRERVRKHRERYNALRNAGGVTGENAASASEDESVQEGGKGGRFQKPTYAQMESYAREINFPVLEINKFFDYYESNGWKVGGRSPMKDWKAAMRNWLRNYNERGGSHGATGAGAHKPQPPKGYDANAGTYMEGQRKDYSKAIRRPGA